MADAKRRSVAVKTLALIAAAAVAATIAAIAPNKAQSQTPFEAQVLAVLNAVRADPGAFATSLQTFRSYFQGAAYLVPGARVHIVTSEGVAAVDDAIASLKGRQGVGGIAYAPLLEAAAADHVAEQAANGATGHRGSDGSSPGERVRRRGGSQYVAEVIEYGANDPVDVVRQLIVDDGVANRGHRRIILDPAMRSAGVSCGPHPVYRTMCVIVMDAHSGREADIEIADATP